MPAPIYGLSESDVSLIKDLIADRKRNVIRTRSRSIEEFLPSTPEVYIALTPLGGIAPLTIQGGLVEPGYAQCTIYQLIPLSNAGTHTPYATQLQKVNIFPQVVYNVSSNLVQGSQYIVVQRDKFGSWITSGCVMCSVISPGTGTGSVMHTCCSDVTLPTTMCLQVTSVSGNCTYFVGDFLLTWNGNDWESGTIVLSPGCTTFARLSCDASRGWILTTSMCTNGFSGIKATSVVCSPFVANFGTQGQSVIAGSTLCRVCSGNLSFKVIGGNCHAGTGTGTGTRATVGGCSGASFTATGCCSGQCIPSPLHLTVTGPCTGFNGTFTLNFNGSRWSTSVFSCSGVTIWYELACVASTPNNFALNIFESGVIGTQSLASRVVCPSPGPLSIEGSFSINPGDSCCATGGTNNWVVTI